MAAALDEMQGANRGGARNHHEDLRLARGWALS